MRIDSSDLPVAVSWIGEPGGDPVLVLPGGACRGPEYLGDLAGLGAVRPLLVLHPRGTARTGGLSRGWWTDADDVVAVIDALGLTSADLLAHSAGTRLALATATRFPDRVRTMALVTPPARWLTGSAHDGEDLVLDRDDPVVAEAIRSLYEDEDGDTEVDIQEASLGSDDRTFLLRSERSGRGTGRIYKVTYEAMDGSGNKTRVTSTVTVDH